MFDHTASAYRIAIPRLDAQGVAGLQAAISKALDSGAHTQRDRMVLDMAEVEFIDSDGLVAMVNIFRSAAAKGIHLILCSVQPIARLVFDISQLDKVFTIIETPAV
jgi:anti-sigma B factor antagonist